MKKTILLGIALLLAAPGAAGAASSYETEVVSGVNFRNAPSTDSYTYRLIPRGEDIHVIEKVNSYWLKIQVQDGTIGYISANSKYTDYRPGASSGSSSSSSQGTITRSVNFRSAPKVASNKISLIKSGTVVQVLEQVNSYWLKINYNGRVGYVSTDYISYTGPAKPSGGSNTSSPSGTADDIINYAKSLMGKVTYDWGTRNADRLIFDCSSFTEHVFEKYGVQMKWGTRYQQNEGVAVSKSNLRKGDLVFFGTVNQSVLNHVGIYIGNGEFIHNSPSSNGVRIDNLNSGFWESHYIKARRVLN